MSKKKNEDILQSILQANLRTDTKEGLVTRMLEQEVAGQRVFYVYLQQKENYDIKPEEMDKNQSDGIFENAIIECKLNENEGGGIRRHI